METSGLIFPFLLAAAALFMIIWMTKAALGPLIGRPKDVLPKILIKKREAALADVERLLRAGDFAGAAETLHGCFFITSGSKSLELVERICALNMAALSKLAAIAAAHRTPFPNLPLVEELFLARTALFHDLIEAAAGLARAKGRLAENNAPMPPWAKSEFEVKIRQIEEKLAVNKFSLEVKLRDIFKEIRAASSQPDVTYH